MFLFISEDNGVAYISLSLDKRYSLTFGFYATSAIAQLVSGMESGKYFDIIPYDVIANPKALEKRIKDHKIDAVFLSPKQIEIMDFSSLPDLKYVGSVYEMFSGVCRSQMGG